MQRPAQALPLLDKATIRAHTEAMKHPQAQGLARFNTGGSSGEPLIFFIGKERVSHDVAAKWRATRWWGVDIGDPEIVVWGSPIELGSQDRVRAWRDRLMRTELLPAFEMNEAKLDALRRPTSGGVARACCSATGAGAAARQSMGTGVFGGMIVATFVAPVCIPLFFSLLARKPRPSHHHAPEEGQA